MSINVKINIVRNKIIHEIPTQRRKGLATRGLL